MKLKSEDGKVTYQMRAGKDMVSAKMDVKIAEKMIQNNPHEIDGEVVVMGAFIFPIEKEPKKSKKSK